MSNVLGRGARAVGAGSLVVSIVSLGLVWGAGSSTAASTFEAVADAQLARVLVEIDPPFLTQFVDPGASSVQARLTSFGESSAFASNPYPGSLAVSVPGLVDSVAGPSTPPELAPFL